MHTSWQSAEPTQNKKPIDHPLYLQNEDDKITRRAENRVYWPGFLSWHAFLCRCTIRSVVTGRVRPPALQSEHVRAHCDRSSFCPPPARNAITPQTSKTATVRPDLLHISFSTERKLSLILGLTSQRHVHEAAVRQHPFAIAHAALLVVNQRTVARLYAKRNDRTVAITRACGCTIPHITLQRQKSK